MSKSRVLPKSRPTIGSMLDTIKEQTGDTQEVTARKIGYKAATLRKAKSMEQAGELPSAKIYLALKSAYPTLFEEKDSKGSLEVMIRNIMERLITVEATNNVLAVMVATILADQKNPATRDRKFSIAAEQLMIQKAVSAEVGRLFSAL